MVRNSRIDNNTMGVEDPMGLPLPEVHLSASEEQAASIEAGDERGGMKDMDWQEKYLDKLDRDVSEMKASLYQTEERIERLVSDLRNELRSEIVEIRHDMRDLRNEVRGINRWVIGLVVSAIVGITAIAVSVIALVGAVLSRM